MNITGDLIAFPDTLYSAPVLEMVWGELGVVFVPLSEPSGQDSSLRCPQHHPWGFCAKILLFIRGESRGQSHLQSASSGCICCCLLP